MISPAGDLRQHMAQVLDPRGREGKRHPLSAILTAVVCAVLCGANGYKPICQWLHKQPVDFWHFLGFTRRPIRYGGTAESADGPRPAGVRGRGLRAWLPSTSPPDVTPETWSAVAIDGKSLGGTGGIDQRAQMLISAYEHLSGTVLRQQAVPADTNEQKAALDLLKQLVLTGRVITADASHCQQETCQLITNSGGHYVIPVKEGQPSRPCWPRFPANSPLRTRPFPPYQRRERKAERRFHEEWHKGHGRREHRTIETTTELNHFLQRQLGWSSVQQVFRITRTRFRPHPQTGQSERSTEVAYGITSLSRKQADAKQLLAYNRGHWGIENGLHYVRDVTFGEDRSRLRKGHGPQHLATTQERPPSPSVD